MDILFVHDHIFKRLQNNVYSPGGLPSSVWERYLSVFDNLTVVGRDGGYLIREDCGHTLSSRKNVDFQLLPNISNLKSLVFGNSEAREHCRKLVSRHDGVIARLPSRMGQLFIAEALRQNKPYSIEVVACPWDALWNYGNWKGKLLAPFAMFNLKSTVARAPFVLYVTAKFLQKRYPCKSGFVASCSNVEIAKVSLEILNKRYSKFKNNSDTLIFGLIGNYSSNYKGIDVAIRALSLADEDLPNWTFNILGSGDYKYYTDLANELGVAEKIKFVGSLPSGQPVYDWLDTIDVYLQPSFQEGLPRALIEAMSRGCPAIGSSVAGIPELLDKEYLVKPGDHQKLARKISDFSTDNEKLTLMSQWNFEKAKNYYKTLLDERRIHFYTIFRKSII